MDRAGRLRYARPMSTRGTVSVAALALALAALGACASTKAGDGDGDASVTDGSIDGVNDPCAGITCPGLQYCKEGTCVPYPACPVDAGTPGPDPSPMCTPGTVCRNGVCVPSGRDVDGDGFPASTDCDEQNGMIHPGGTEICNGLDEDCSGTVDDGDPAVLCSGAQAGNVCVMGSCVCPDGNFDLDPTVPGCECTATPAVGMGTTCQTAIDLGSLSDGGAGMAQHALGNIPNGRQVWFKFRGVDSADTACDNYHVAAKFSANPTDQFRIRAFRGDCNTPITPPGQYTEVAWFTDFRQSIGGNLVGECPCWSGTPVDNVSPCQDSSADYYVVVERTSGGTDTCASFDVELSNGVYDGP